MPEKLQEKRKTLLEDNLFLSRQAAYRVNLQTVQAEILKDVSYILLREIQQAAQQNKAEKECIRQYYLCVEKY